MRRGDVCSVVGCGQERANGTPRCLDHALHASLDSPLISRKDTPTDATHTGLVKRDGFWIHPEQTEGDVARCVRAVTAGYCGAHAVGWWASRGNGNSPLCQSCYDEYKAGGTDAGKWWSFNMMFAPVPNHSATHRRNPYLCRGDLTCEDCGMSSAAMADRPCPWPGTGKGRDYIEDAVTGRLPARRPRPVRAEARYRSPAGFGPGSCMGGALWSYGWAVRR